MAWNTYGVKIISLARRSRDRLGKGAEEILVNSAKFEKRDVLKLITLLFLPLSLGCNGPDRNGSLIDPYELSNKTNALFDALAVDGDQLE